MTTTTTNPSSTATRKYVSSKTNTTIIDKMIGEPTLVTYRILFDQLAIAASSVKTNQWGGRHGHLPLLVSDAQFVTITGIATAVTTKCNKPSRIDARINGNLSNYDRLCYTREQDEKT